MIITRAGLSKKQPTFKTSPCPIHLGDGIDRVYGGGKTASAFPYQLIELQPLNRVIDREDRKAAVGFAAGTQGAAGVDSRDAAKAFDTLYMCVSMYGDCAAETFGCHT